MHLGTRFLVTLSLGFFFVASGLAWASALLLEKIFIHDHDREEGFQELKKMPRVDFENDDLRRILEELKNSVPQYTGYFFLDLISEFFKTILVFFMTLLVPVSTPETTN